MDYQQYIEDCLTTESPYSFELPNGVTPRLLHGAIGLVTETAELLDSLKKTIFYGKPLDKVNIIEELGDILWYLSLVLKDRGITYDQLLENIALDTENPIQQLIERHPQIGQVSGAVFWACNRMSLRSQLMLEEVNNSISFQYPTLNSKLTEIKTGCGIILSGVIILAEIFDSSIEEVMAININKLKFRYPDDRFTSNCAINRNTEAERQLLETQIS